MKKILIIEDNAQTRYMFLECLQEEGFEAIGAVSGRLGIQIAKEYQPDLVICDIIMPGLDGYEVLEELRQNPMTVAIPLIFLTVKTDETDRSYSMSLGAKDYLTKPCTVKEFRNAIAQVLKLT
jgi:CheY-like chemotaxis protein